MPFADCHVQHFPLSGYEWRSTASGPHAPTDSSTSANAPTSSHRWQEDQQLLSYYHLSADRQHVPCQRPDATDSRCRKTIGLSGCFIGFFLFIFLQSRLRTGQANEDLPAGCPATLLFRLLIFSLKILPLLLSLFFLILHSRFYEPIRLNSLCVVLPNNYIKKNNILLVVRLFPFIVARSISANYHRC